MLASQYGQTGRCRAIQLDPSGREEPVQRLVEAARRGQPQLVTRRGAPAVVVFAAEDYARLRTLEQAAQPSFVEHLLAMPCDDERFERIDVDPRATEF